jgi:alkyl sulfatase BDS1-like metallo-beta-lactamase superfamily hydrolase
MGTVRDISEKLWSGELTTSQPEAHPFCSMMELEEVTSRVGFYKAFSNITAVRTDDGMVLIDTGSFHPLAQQRAHAKIRHWESSRLHTAIYTHGHVDHAYGLPPFLEEAKEKHWPRPAIVGHHAVPARMDRYIETAGYNEVINLRQFGQAIEWPTDPIRPTLTYLDRLELRVGNHDFHLIHARGETDDHTWVYLPQERVLCTGDLFIWAVPNAGNPQKVQRYCIEWCHALRQMAALSPEFLLPGHGVLIEGQPRVRAALMDTADYLESIYRQTVDLMNTGASIEDIIHAVKPPESLSKKPYLQPVYDEPEFIVRNIHRCLGGWYTGIPSELKPAPRSQQAVEIVALAGGVEKLLERAGELVERGQLQLACHLADWAADADPDNPSVHRLRAEVYGHRSEAETSTMAQGIFSAASADSTAKASSGE